MMVTAAACNSPASTGAPSTPAPAATTAPAAATATTAPAGSPAPAVSVPGGFVGVGLIKAGYEGEAKALTGAGSTFVAPLFSKWFDVYSKLTGVQVNYQANGSGAGIKAV